MSTGQNPQTAAATKRAPLRAKGGRTDLPVQQRGSLRQRLGCLTLGFLEEDAAHRGAFLPRPQVARDGDQRRNRRRAWGCRDYGAFKVHPKSLLVHFQAVPGYDPSPPKARSCGPTVRGGCSWALVPSLGIFSAQPWSSLYQAGGVTRLKGAGVA